MVGNPRDVAKTQFYILVSMLGCVSLVLLLYIASQWHSVYEAYNTKYAIKTCVVKATKLDEFTRERTQVFLPKVLVTIREDLRVQGGEIWAFRYHPDFSSTWHAQYNDVFIWLSQFTVGKHVPCWQGVNDPEIVKLSEKTVVEEQFWSYGSVLFMTLFMVVFCGGACFGLYTLFKKATTRKRVTIGDRESISFLDEDSADESAETPME